ncbi:MAG: hypothetical protein GX442_02455 [Candidatus Riflebacteria bacterium]|nr:hypothetical protein [Candidatus Riflebacteria bacterium]
MRDHPDGGATTLNAALMVRTAETLDYRFDRFRLQVPLNATPQDCMLTVSSTFPGSEARTLPRGFSPVSDLYRINLRLRLDRLLQPVRLDIPLFPDLQVAAGNDTGIFLARRQASSPWELISPTIDPLSRTAAVMTWRLSEWMAVRCTGFEHGYPLAAPGLTATPAVALLDRNGWFAQDLRLDSLLPAPVAGAFDLSSWRVTMQLFPDPALALEVRPPAAAGNGQSLSPDPIQGIRIPLETAAFVERTTGTGGATFSFALALSGKTPSQVPQIIDWGLTAWNGTGPRFLREGRLIVQPQSAAAAVSLPRVLETVPADLAVGVPRQSFLEIAFDRAMEPLSVARALSLTPDPGAASWTWLDGRSALVRFDLPLAVQTTYHATLGTEARDLEGGALARPFRWSFTTAAAADTYLPSLVQVSPPNGAQNVPCNARLAMRFSETMEVDSVEKSVRVLRPDVGTLSWFWTADRTTVAVVPNALWKASDLHEILIGTGCRDLEGNALVAARQISFTTGAKSGPTVIGTVPANGSPLTGPLASLKFQFDRPMDKASVAAGFSTWPVAPVTATFTWNPEDTEVLITWDPPWMPTSDLVASFSGFARDKEGIALAGETRFQFPLPDLTAPTITAFLPASGSLGVPTNAALFLQFSEPMNRTSVEQSLAFSPPATSLTFQWNASGTETWVNPGLPWPALATVRWFLATAAADLHGNGLSAAWSVAFTTSSQVAPTLTGAVPANGQTGVFRTTIPTLRFSQAMDPVSVKGALSLAPAGAVPPVLTWKDGNQTLEVAPPMPLANFATYELAVGQTAKSAGGIPLSQPIRITFTTADTEPPNLVRVAPADGQANVDPATTVELAFDEPVSRTSVPAAWSLSPPPAGTASFTWPDDRTVRISWSKPLPGNTRMTGRLGTATADLLGNHPAAPWEFTFTTADPTPPTLVQTTPANGATGVPLFPTLQFGFSKTMATNTVQVGFLPEIGGTPTRSWSADGRTLTLAWNVALAPSTAYQATVAASAADLLGQTLTGTRAITFTTGAVLNPRIVRVSPTDGTVIATTVLRLQVVFDRAMDQAAVTAGLRLSPAPPGGTLLAWDGAGSTLTVTSGALLPAGTTFTCTIASTVTDASNVALGRDFATTFQTEAAPVVVAGGLFPPDGATGVASGVVIRVPFSKTMDQTATAKAFALLRGGLAEAGTVSWSGSTLSFAPASPLRPGQAYSVFVGAGARDAQGIALAAAFSAGFTTAAGVAPTVTAVRPESGATGVPLDTPLEIAFSAPMEPATVIPLFRPVPQQAPTLAWSDGNRLLTLRFPLGLEPATTLEWTVGPGARDQDGLALTPPGSFTLQTVSPAGPRLIAAVPAPGAAAANPLLPIRLTFDQPMDQASVQAAFSLVPAPGGPVQFAWPDSQTMTASFAQPLLFGTPATITVGTGARNQGGVALSEAVTIGFSTLGRPVVLTAGVRPADGATGVATNAELVLPFSRLMDEAAVQAAFTMTANSAAVGGSFSWSGSTMTFRPTGPLPVDGTIAVTVGAAAPDRLGLTLGTVFTTGFATVRSAPPTVTGGSPAAGATGVAVDSAVTVTFSKPMASPTVAVAVSPAGPTPVRSWSADGTVLTLSQPGGWPGGTLLTVTVPATAADTAGNLLGSAFSLSFTTQAIAGPRVIAMTPLPDAADVPVATAITLRFDAPMATASVESAVTVAPPPAGTPVRTWSADWTRLTLQWPAPLPFGQAHGVTVTTAATSMTGSRLAVPFLATFTTEAAPAVAAVTPAAGATGIATDATIRVQFNKEMNHLAAEQAFSLVAGTGPITGTFSWEGLTQVFRPGSPLPASATLGVTVDTTARDTRDNALATRFSSTFQTVPAPALRLASTSPVDGQTAVPLLSPVVLEFSNPMVVDTVTVGFSPAPAGTLTQTWNASGTRLSIAFGSAFAANQTYQVTVAAGARDVYGGPLTGVTGFSFRTVAVTAPQVVSLSPAPGAVEVARQAPIVFIFDRAMDRASTAGAFTIQPVVDAPAFAWSAGDTTLSVTFPASLSYATAYEATVGVTARDATGTALVTAVSTAFTTEARPRVVAGSEFPTPGAEGIATNTRVAVTFSKTMNRATTEAAFRLTAGGTAVPGSFAWQDRTLEFTPAGPLPISTACTVTITTAATDERGNSLASPYSWTFTTRGLEGAAWRCDLPDDPLGSHFSERQDHAVVSFGGSLWLIGGNDGAFRNDVWRSDDGKTWTEVAADAPTAPGRFSPRAGHACLVYDNRLWVIGGEVETATGIDVMDDAWYTTDGVSWTVATTSADFWARGYATAVAYDGKMWLLGGRAYDPDGNVVLLGDAWTSTDGVRWTEVPSSVSYFPRMYPTAAVLGGRLWVFGGYGTNAAGVTGPLGDAWVTTTGAVWNRVAEQAGYSARYGAALLFHKNNAWLIGGIGRDTDGWETYLNDVWSTPDGTTWTRVLDNAPAGPARFEGRARAGAAVHDGRMVVTGGETNLGPLNDVWSSE